MDILCKHFDDLSREELYGILQLRAEVFVVEQDCPYQDLDGNDLDELDKAAMEKAKTTRRPPLNYFTMGLNVGQVLVYTEDPSVTCTVVNGRKVSFEGEETSLTKLTMKLLNKAVAVQPTPYWTANGKNLNELYNEVYPIEDDKYLLIYD